jgi:hypothetical protein
MKNITKNVAILNVAFNVLMAIILVYFNILSLSKGFEETFIALALIYGVITTIGNYLFVSYSKKSKQV